MMNIKFGRWKMICQPAQDIALGKYGKAPGPINPEILALVEKQTGTKAVTQRPADLLQPGLENYKKQCAEKGLPTTDEIAVLFAMFPQQVEALIKGTPPAGAKPAPAAAKPAAPASSSSTSALTHMVLTIDGHRHEVSVEKLSA
jgi:oxaloacetate decarboxylase alpha subunit/pyruvate carboxylase subunit B